MGFKGVNIILACFRDDPETVSYQAPSSDPTFQVKLINQVTDIRSKQDNEPYENLQKALCFVFPNSQNNPEKCIVTNKQKSHLIVDKYIEKNCLLQLRFTISAK